MPHKQVVIIGGGFGGLTAAQSLHDADVWLIDRTNHHLFQPLLYQVATAALAPGDIAWPLRTIFRRHPHVRVVMDEVLSIDRVARLLWMRDSPPIAFDILVVAPGSRHSYFGPLGEVYVADALFHDWEDIAIDNEKHLFIGDIGNNEAKRTELAVYQVDEPNPKANVGFIQPKRTWRLRFPGEPFDCESLFVWDGYGYVVSKVFKDARAQIFRFPLADTKEPLTLELVATTKIESPVTGADISPDGALLALVAKSGAFLYRVDGNPAKAGKGKPFQTKFRHEHIEACAFVPEGLLATAESREIYLFTDEAFRTGPGKKK